MSNLPPRIQQLLSSFEERATALTQAQESIQQTRGQAQNREGSVSVTVAPSGAVIDLRLGPRAMQKTAIQLQQEIMEAIRAATTDAAARVEETLQPVLGDQLDAFKAGLEGNPVRPFAREFDLDEERFR